MKSKLTKEKQALIILIVAFIISNLLSQIFNSPK